MIRYSEHLPNAPEDDRQLPDLSFAFYNRMIVFDHVTKTVTVVAMADTSGDASAAYAAAAERIDATIRQITTGPAMEPAEVLLPSREVSLKYESNFDADRFRIGSQEMR